jgi:hypothetical protein
MEKTTKTAHNICQNALDFAERLMMEMVTGGMASDGFMASADILDAKTGDGNGGWYMGDTDLTAVGDDRVVLSTSAEFEDAQQFADSAFSAYSDCLALATQKQSLNFQDVYETFRQHSVRTWNDSNGYMGALNDIVQRYGLLDDQGERLAATVTTSTYS